LSSRWVNFSRCFRFLLMSMTPVSVMLELIKWLYNDISINKYWDISSERWVNDFNGFMLLLIIFMELFVRFLELLDWSITSDSQIYYLKFILIFSSEGFSLTYLQRRLISLLLFSFPFVLFKTFNHHFFFYVRKSILRQFRVFSTFLSDFIVLEQPQPISSLFILNRLKLIFSHISDLQTPLKSSFEHDVLFLCYCLLINQFLYWRNLCSIHSLLILVENFFTLILGWLVVIN